MHTSDFLTRLMTEMPGQHHVLAPLEDTELEDWCAIWPRKFMPEDLLALLCQANGIQLWVSEGSPQGYFRLLPLHEIDSARQVIWGEYGGDMTIEDIPYPHWLAISEDQDHSDYIVLDTLAHQYYLMDSCGADLTNPLGGSVEELLDSIWRFWVKGPQASDAA